MKIFLSIEIEFMAVTSVAYVKIEYNLVSDVEK